MNVYPEQAENVLAFIRAGKVPSQFCGTEIGVPNDASTIEEWAVAHPEFADKYNEAKRIGADAMVAYCISIADSSLYKADAKKVMIDTRLKIAAIWNPDKYGARAEKEPQRGIMAHIHMPFDKLTPSQQRDVEDMYSL